MMIPLRPVMYVVPLWWCSPAWVCFIFCTLKTFLYFVDIALWWARYVCIILPQQARTIFWYCLVVGFWIVSLYRLLVGFRHVCIILPYSGPWYMISSVGRLLMYVWTLPLDRPYMYVSRYHLLVGSNAWFLISPLGRLLMCVWTLPMVGLTCMFASSNLTFMSRLHPCCYSCIVASFASHHIFMSLLVKFDVDWPTEGYEKGTDRMKWTALV